MRNKDFSSCVVLISVVVAVFHTVILANEKTATDNDSNATKETAVNNDPNAADNSETNILDYGVMPQLGMLFKVPEEYRLRLPTEPVVPNEPVKYKRFLPLMAQKVVDRGYALPRPIGLTVIGVYNEQE